MQEALAVNAPAVKDVVARLTERIPDPLFYRLLARQFRSQEPELRRLSTFVPPDAPAIDVGAWWGPWTYWLSRQVPHVVAFEPQPRLAAFLKRVTGRNVTVRAEALSDASGPAVLRLGGLRRGQDALAALDCDGASESESATITVPTCRLDDLDVEAVGFVKIDAEGHESAVLRGGQELIRRCSPVLFVEIEQRHIGYPIERSFTEIVDLGYRGYFLWRGRWLPVDELDVDVHQASSHVLSHEYVNNFLFVPERAADLHERLRQT